MCVERSKCLGGSAIKRLCLASSDLAASTFLPHSSASPRLCHPTRFFQCLSILPSALHCDCTLVTFFKCTNKQGILLNQAMCTPGCVIIVGLSSSLTLPSDRTTIVLATCSFSHSASKGRFCTLASHDQGKADIHHFQGPEDVLGLVYDFHTASALAAATRFSCSWRSCGVILIPVWLTRLGGSSSWLTFSSTNMLSLPRLFEFPSCLRSLKRSMLLNR